MIAEFENPNEETYTEVPFRVYGMKLEHKHVREIEKWSGLSQRPLFVPSVGRYYKGMIVQVPLQLRALPGQPSPAAIQGALADHYDGCRFVTVAGLQQTDTIGLLMPEDLNDTNELRLHVFGNEARGQAVLNRWACGPGARHSLRRDAWQVAPRGGRRAVGPLCPGRSSPIRCTAVVSRS